MSISEILVHEGLGRRRSVEQGEKVQTKAEMKQRCSTEISLQLHWGPS